MLKTFLFLPVAVCLCVPAMAELVFNMTTIGNPGNAPDSPYGDPEVLVGSVDYVYQISTYEVTVSQYVAFLNAVAASDPYGLYHADMSDPLMTGGAIVTRSGEDGSYTYSSVAGKENQPVRYVSFYDGLRLCNWLYNGQGDGDTEDGSYTLSDGKWLVRNEGATWVLASKDEWHKAAYYDPETGTYNQYPNGSDTIEYPTDGTTPRDQNFGDDPYWAPDGPLNRQYITSIGETTGYSAYGVCDMGGNVEEWTDFLNPPGYGYYRVVCGGTYADDESYLARDGAISRDPAVESSGRGLRLVYLIPEPSTIGLALLGFWVVRHCRKRRAMH